MNESRGNSYKRFFNIQFIVLIIVLIILFGVGYYSIDNQKKEIYENNTDSHNKENLNNTDNQNEKTYEDNINMTRKLIEQEDYTGAKKYLDKAIAVNPFDSVVLLLKEKIDLGIKLDHNSLCRSLYRKDTIEGDKCIDNYKIKYPDDDSICVVYDSTGYYKQAYDCYDSFIPEGIEYTQYDKIKCYIDIDKKREKMKFEEYKLLKEKCLEIWQYKGTFRNKCLSLKEFGDKKDIKKCYDDLLRIYDLFDFEYNFVGHGYYAADYYTGALEAYTIYLNYLNSEINYNHSSLVEDYGWDADFLEESDKNETLELELIVCEILGKLKNDVEKVNCLDEFSKKYPDKKGILKEE